MNWMKSLLMLLGVVIIGASPVAAIRIATLDDYPEYRAEDGAYILGYEEAPARIVYFEDPLCPHCWDYKLVMDTIIERYVLSGQVQIESRILPTQEFSATTAGILECAERLTPHTYWGAKEVFYGIASQEPITERLILQTIPETLGIEIVELTECLPTAQQHETDTVLFHHYGLTGVPSVFIFERDNLFPVDLSTTSPSLEELDGAIQSIIGADI